MTWFTVNLETSVSNYSVCQKLSRERVKNLCFVSLLMIRFYIGTWSAGQGQLPPRQLNFISEETMWLGPRLLHMRTWDWCGSSAVKPMWLCSHWHTFNFFSSWSQFASLGGTYDLLIYMKGREIEIFHLLGHSKKKKKMQLMGAEPGRKSGSWNTILTSC